MKSPSFLVATLPVLFLMTLLFFNVSLFGDDTLSGASQMVLLLASTVAIGIAIFFLGFQWKTILDSIVKGVFAALPALLILLMIGCLSGTWMLSGVVPTIIYYGLDILNPTIFLFASCIVSALISVAIGSSWTTIATIGVALMGIGQALNFNEGLVAGAIISGAYFGDKMSPVSDTTNLAAAIAETPLFTHIRYVTYTTIPSFIISLIIFLSIGLFQTTDSSIQIASIQKDLEAAFFIHPVLLLVPVVAVTLIARKVEALPVLMLSSIMAALFAIVFQADTIQAIAFTHPSFLKTCGVAQEIATTLKSSLWDSYQWEGNYIVVLQSMFGDMQIPTSNAALQSLLNTGGMAGMLNTVWLIISAMVFGSAMEATHMLQTIVGQLIKKIRSIGSLFRSTVITALLNNILTADQYLSIVITGRMYKEVYKEKGLKSENLSRTIEDAATVTSVLVPWNTCGATQASVLGVATFTYLPFCFFNLISPIMTLIFGYFQIKIRYREEQKKQSE